jgi:hypothetical protein
MSSPVNKRAKLQLVGLDGNVFCLLGAFINQARREGWTQAEIDAVVSEAQSRDYGHLLVTLADHCEEP